TYEGDGYHVRLLDAATLVVLAARKFHEDRALTPWPAQERSSHALRLGSGALYVALAERDPRLVKLRLPSLAPEASLVFPTPNAHRTLSTSAALSAPPAPLSFDTGADRYLLSGDLRLLAPLPATAAPREDESSSEMMGERVSQRMFGRTVSTAVRNERWVLRVAP
ncbi:MAG TPA: hypothetical protein VLT33_35035, partial [Labilithrix sp.]|nr:hypothetical protein [Labilithrix sp.]